RADQTPQKEISAFRRSGEQRPVRLGRGDLDEQDVLPVHQENRDDRREQDRHAGSYHAFRPELVVELAAEPGAESAGDGQDDAEAADPDRVPAEGAGGIDAAE